MSIIVPITRREFVQRLTLALVPLPATMAADPAFAAGAAGLGVDVGAVQWGRGVTLVAPLAAAPGAEIAVHARPDAGSRVAEIILFTPAAGRAASARFLVGEAPAPLSLSLPVRRSQVVAAVLRGADGALSGVLADLRLIG